MAEVQKKRGVETVVERLFKKMGRRKLSGYENEIRRRNFLVRRAYFVDKAVKAGFTRKQAKFLFENLAGKDHEHHEWRA